MIVSRTSRFPILAVALLCAVPFLALPGKPAQAQASAEQQNALRQNCRSDFMAHCSGVTPGGTEAMQCLQRNAARLSPACRTAVGAIAPRAPAAPAPATAAPAPPPRSPAAAAAATPSPAMQPTAQQQAALRQFCQTDFKARCAGVQPGGTAAVQCLQRNSARLSPNCQRAVAAIGGRAPAAAASAAARPAPAPAAASALTPAQQQVVRNSCRMDFLKNCKGVKPDGPQALACLKRNVGFVSPNCRTSLVAVGAVSSEAATAAAAAAPPLPPGIHPAGKIIRRAIQRDHLQRQGQ